MTRLVMLNDVRDAVAGASWDEAMRGLGGVAMDLCDPTLYGGRAELRALDETLRDLHRQCGAGAADPGALTALGWIECLGEIVRCRLESTLSPEQEAAFADPVLGRVLLTLHRNPRCTSSELVAALGGGWTPSRVSKTLSSLRGLGFVVSARSGKELRSWLLPAAAALVDDGFEAAPDRRDTGSATRSPSAADEDFLLFLAGPRPIREVR